MQKPNYKKGEKLWGILGFDFLGFD